MPNEDQILSEQLHAGNKDVFSELFAVHYRRLVMEAFYLLRDEQESKDVVQEVFIDVWHRQHLQEITSVKAYLTQAVRNRCLNVLKAAKSKEQKEKQYQYSFAAGNAVGKEPDEPEMAALQQQRTDNLQLAIRELPPKTAKIFQLYYIEKKSRNDVAMEVGVTINTVKTVLARALQFLRKKLQ